MSINQPSLYIGLLQATDLDALYSYLLKLGPETRKRFAPHAFDREMLDNLFIRQQDLYRAYIAKPDSMGEIIAYAVVIRGFLLHDLPRLQGYGLNLSHETDCTIAPSVADRYQQKGVGSLLMSHIIHDLEKTAINRMILWGGVQAENQTALRFYLRHGFVKLGEFDYHGLNWDMCLNINS
ncbi:MAG: GNAT family N-acetyltransferase [Bacteroidales bacterium]|nr:GNAT family N-acetyltransferase [Bacteroidales bacterium]